LHHFQYDCTIIPSYWQEHFVKKGTFICDKSHLSKHPRHASPEYRQEFPAVSEHQVIRTP
jgi:hypothetical protein